MLDQILEGGCSALVGLLIAGIGYGLYTLGKMQVEGYFETGKEWYANKFIAGMPKWKAAVVTFVLATFLGMVASCDHVEYDGSGDGIYPGQVVEVTENQRRCESFMRVFVFSLAATWLGIAKTRVPTVKK